MLDKFVIIVINGILFSINIFSLSNYNLAQLQFILTAAVSIILFIIKKKYFARIFLYSVLVLILISIIWIINNNISSIFSIN
jgi:hypothetical protein